MKRMLGRDRFVILLILVIVASVFIPLFYPESKIVVTPDFGRSDAWHFSIATKASLSRFLKSGSLPLWEPLLGGGFPLMAEGQISALFLPNLILFRILPFITAYNAALALVFAMIAVGTYLFVRSLDRSRSASFFAALVLTFSGLPVVQVPHITLLQGMSVLPLILWAANRHIGTGKFSWIILLSFLLSQQIFAGFPQSVFITALLVALLLLRSLLRTGRFTPLGTIGIGYLLGAGMGAAQLLPSYEFLTQIGTTSGFDYETASYFSMPFKHLASFLRPFAFGNPKLGTYPHFSAFNGSIFWENTAYMGIIPLLLSAVFFLRGKSVPERIFWICTIGGSVLLAMGKFAPTYIVFSFWPFTLFRVPSRFLWVTAFCIAVCSSYGWDILMRYFRKSYAATLCLSACLIGFSSYQLYAAWHGYNLIEPYDTWMRRSPILSVLPDDARVLTPDVHLPYSRAMSQGWTDPSAYRDLRYIPMPDSNILFPVTSHTAYAGRFLRRNTYADTLLYTGIDIGSTISTISAEGVRLLALYGINTLIMTGPLDQSVLPKPDIVPISESLTATVFTLLDAMPRFRMAYTATSAATVREAVSRLGDTARTSDATVLLEKSDITEGSGLTEFIGQRYDAADADMPEISLVRSEPTHITLRVLGNPKPGLLVSLDTYYPNWRARVDGKPAEIYPANLTERAIRIPAGDHTVDIAYVPLWFYWGVCISALSALLTTGLAVYPAVVSSIRTGRIGHRLFRHRRRSPSS